MSAGRGRGLVPREACRDETRVFPFVVQPHPGVTRAGVYPNAAHVYGARSSRYVIRVYVCASWLI